MAAKPQKRERIGTERAPDSREPQAELWSAVIRQAHADVFEIPKAVGGYTERVKAREEALHFLTDAEGEWAQHRELVCGLTGGGEDADRLRERTLYQMVLTPPPEIQMSDAERKHVERAAAWQVECQRRAAQAARWNALSPVERAAHARKTRSTRLAAAKAAPRVAAAE